MQSGSQAIADRRFDDAERLYKEAVQIAEKLPLPELRLTTALGHLGQLTMNRKDFSGAQALFQRQLQVTGKSFGSQSPMNAEPLKWLAFNATAQGDSATAQKFFDRVLDLNRKAYGENSTGYSEAFRDLAVVYIYQQADDKAEPYLVQAAAIEERLYGYRSGPMASVNLDTLCNLYEHWDRPDKLEACDRRLIAATEKQYGPDSQFLEPTLTREAKTLRALGRPQEAEKIEQRLKSLQPSAANGPN
jgi:tetratricopeptide (TPR) repeat protein